MSGIVFFKTSDLSDLEEFYTSRVGAEKWLEQEDCIILRHGNILLGFCERDETDECGIITFFYDSKSEVDRMYEELEDIAIGEPEENDKYEIYQFFAQDPDGRTLEFQSFLHPVSL